MTNMMVKIICHDYKRIQNDLRSQTLLFAKTLANVAS